MVLHIFESRCNLVHSFIALFSVSFAKNDVFIICCNLLCHSNLRLLRKKTCAEEAQYPVTAYKFLHNFSWIVLSFLCWWGSSRVRTNPTPHPETYSDLHMPRWKHWLLSHTNFKFRKQISAIKRSVKSHLSSGNQ